MSPLTNPYAGHEKGSVENAVGYIRRNVLVPVPYVESFPGLTDYLLVSCDELLPKQHYRENVPIQSLFDIDVETMRDLPGGGFDACTWLERRVDKVGNIDVTGVKYYVGDAVSGQRIHVGMRAFTVEARSLTGESITSHPRVYGQHSETVRRPEQLLAGLVRKPGAFANSPLAGSLPEPFLTLLVHADNVERRLLLRLFEHATRVSGFDVATREINDIVQSGRPVAFSEVEMVATRAREHPHQREEHGPALESSSRADLSVYDKFTGAAA